MTQDTCKRCGLPKDQWPEGRWKDPLCKVGPTTYECHTERVQDTLQLCTKCNTMKHCTDGVCGRCAVPEPVKRMVDAFDEAFLPYDCETSNGHTCHLEKYRPKIKDFLTTHATTLYNDAYSHGKEDGKLEEIEANTVSDITIAKDKVEQIRNDAVREERERIKKSVELLACKVDARKMGASGIEIRKVLTPPTDNPKSV